MSSSVNKVWNFCNESAVKQLCINSKWLSGYDLNKLTTGCSVELGLHSQTVQYVCEEYAKKRKQFKRKKLNWRSYKKTLGWIPFKKSGIKINNDSFVYCGINFRVWKSREHGQIKCGSFNQDSRGRWYLNLVCEALPLKYKKTTKSVGIDLGLKTIVTCSNGDKINRENITRKFEEKLAMAQRANKKRQTANIHAKIKNIRNDFNQKETTKLIKRFGKIVVGNVSSSKLMKTRMAKSVSDAGWSAFKSLLEYKAIRFGRDFKEVNESFSTVTCSKCLNKTKQLSGLRTLGVREWTCEFCGTLHDRDVNAAKNILRTGHCALKGIPLL